MIEEKERKFLFRLVEKKIKINKKSVCWVCKFIIIIMCFGKVKWGLIWNSVWSNFYLCYKYMYIVGKIYVV